LNSQDRGYSKQRLDDKWLPNIIYIARKLGWSLAEIKKLTPRQASKIVRELSFQEKQEQYLEDYSMAFLAATIINCTPRKSNRTYSPKDFVGEMPTREVKQEKEIDIMELAKSKGLEIPKEVE
jgi:hypothetical protein